MNLTGRQERLYETLSSVAQEGRRCPTNKVLAEQSNLVSASTVADSLGRLEKKGLIVVRHEEGWRVIDLVKLEISTARPRPRDPNDLSGLSQLRLAALRQEERARLFPEPKPWRQQFRRSGWRPKTCQYIAGDPSRHESAKCGAVTQSGSSYCAFHKKICIVEASKPRKRGSGWKLAS